MAAERRPLHFDGAVQRIDDARKIRQQAVAGGADDAAALRGDETDQRRGGAARAPGAYPASSSRIRRLKATTSACRMAASFRFRVGDRPPED